MNIVFFGSDEFAATSLEHLLKSDHHVRACVTQPDTRQGRGLSLALSPIKVLAAEHGIEYIQPASLKDALVVEQLKTYGADIFVVVAYGKLLTQDILGIPSKFCVNAHGSLLPKYRGAAPINWAVLNGEQETGVTIQKVALALDAGDIIAQAKINIPFDISADQLRSRMAKLGAELLVTSLDNIEADKFKLTSQEGSQVTFAPKLTKDMGHIDWTKEAHVIYNQIRGLKPWPGTYTMFNGKMLKILAAEIRDSPLISQGKPGEVIAVDKKGFSVACGQGALIIREVQPEASKSMSAASFVAGHKVSAGLLFA